ncbi:MAG TPA: NACHT domain-containing protein [Candidatus Dormibacteraeota bacterium]|nr:NACHT domain-containing protein [Candidatus Dormibacteraeota bacterium]
MLLQIVAEALFGKAAEAAAVAGRAALAGEPLERTLAEELEAALRESVASCRSDGAAVADDHDVVALLEHVHRANPRLRTYLTPPPSIFAEERIRAYWERVTDELLEPLGDPDVTGVGRSWADLNGIDLHRLSRTFVSTLWRRLRRRRYGGDLHGLLAEAEHQEVLAAIGDLREAVDRAAGQPAGRSAADAFARYLRSEARLDSRVRLKEMAYAGELFQVFVDPRLEDHAVGSRRRTPRSLVEPNSWVGRVLLGAWEAIPLRVVVDAPPGYGKSTVVQYVGQVHRLLHLAGSEASQSPLAELIGQQPVRLPVRIQCKQLATWMSDLADGTPVSIDAYLAEEISRRGAPGRCAPQDVIGLLRSRDVLLAIDGHDEIRNDATRQAANEALLDFIAELLAAARSLQVIVTRRPAIYGSDDQTFEGYTILPLARFADDEIAQFARRWLRSKHGPDEDLWALEREAMRKLGHQNVAALATNPLQLTILMQLADQLADLPHRRTELYDRYVDVFFNREASKWAEVREHRQHLEYLHEYVAWRLVSRTDRGLAAGLTRAELDEMLATFVGRAGLPPPLIEDLTSGVERVFLLVSNSQGDPYDFEVESLKEYFCARYVYQAAGAGKEDDPPAVGPRFMAMASRPGWLNVTRFYAGRYRQGELADIRYCVRQMLRGPTLGLLAAPRIAAMQLIADGVFEGGEHAVDLTRDLLDDIVDEHGVRHVWRQWELWEPLDERRGLLGEVARRLAASILEAPSRDAERSIREVLDLASVHPDTRGGTRDPQDRHDAPGPAYEAVGGGGFVCRAALRRRPRGPFHRPHRARRSALVACRVPASRGNDGSREASASLGWCRDGRRPLRGVPRSGPRQSA